MNKIILSFFLILPVFIKSKYDHIDLASEINNNTKQFYRDLKRSEQFTDEEIINLTTDYHSKLSYCNNGNVLDLFYKLKKNKNLENLSYEEFRDLNFNASVECLKEINFRSLKNETGRAKDLWESELGSRMANDTIKKLKDEIDWFKKYNSGNY